MKTLKQTQIRKFNKDQIDDYLEVIQKSFKTVADALGMTKGIFPASGAFLDKNDICKLINKGANLYGLFVGDESGEKLVGCIAFSSKDGLKYKLMKLAILPAYRHCAYGSFLMNFAEEKIASLGGKTISLGMVAENEILKAWYLSKGFKVLKTKAYKATNYHICFMEKTLSDIGQTESSNCQDTPYEGAYNLRPCKSSAVICLLTHEREKERPTNTGQLIKEVLPEDTEIFYWSRVEPDQKLLELLNQENYYPILVFPAYGEDRVLVDSEMLKSIKEKRLVFLILDGTWKEARKMLRKSPYLNNLPYLALEDLEKTRYTLRRNKDIDHICTVEVAIELFKRMENQRVEETLNSHFEYFLQNYKA